MPENILRSFVRQLSTSPNKDGIQDSLVQLYHQKQRDGSNKLTIPESETLLFKLIQAYPQTILILDALDECHQHRRAELIEVFNRLIKNPKRVKIFISSRRDLDIKHQLEKRANIEIEATDNQDDIGRFVADRISQDQKVRRKPIPEDLQKEIVQTLLEKSRGM